MKKKGSSLNRCLATTITVTKGGHTSRGGWQCIASN